jgi:hypothetical protein
MASPLLATPAIWYPGQSDQEWITEIEALAERSAVTTAFLSGQIAPDHFLDYLAADGYDPLEIAEDWEECLQPLISNH